MKVCSKCKVEKDFGDFYRDSRSRDALRYCCKICDRDSDRRWSRNNPGKKRESNAKWLAAKPDYFVSLYNADREHHIKRAIAWQKANPDKKRATAQRRRAREQDAVVEPFNYEDLVSFWASRKVNPKACWYCEKGQPETLDHMVPLCRGGKHSKFNLVPACRSCNSRKHTKTVDEFAMHLEKLRDAE